MPVDDGVRIVPGAIVQAPPLSMTDPPEIVQVCAAAKVNGAGNKQTDTGQRHQRIARGIGDPS
jgi:hypothetical protein